MKTLIVFVGVATLINLSSHAQVLNNYSKVTSIKYGETIGKFSGISNPLFYQVNGNKGLQTISNPLYFDLNPNGSNRPSNPEAKNTSELTKEVKTVYTPPVEKKQTSIGLPTVKDIPVAVTTTGANRSAEISKELGSEYIGSIPLYRALIIGISEYKYSDGKLPSLERPTQDAQNLYNVLTKKYSFEEKDVKLLLNPTRKQIIDAFELLSYEVGVKDNLLIFYAGHGVYDKVKEFGYWLPSDAKSTTRSEWIPNSQIKDYMGAINSKHTLLITDACFGGSIFKSRAIDASTIMRIHDLYKDPSRKAITSGNLSEVPDKSPFIEFLLKKLDENEDLFLPTQQVFSRIFEPVTNNSTATPQFGVIQGTGDEGGDFVFIKKINK